MSKLNEQYFKSRETHKKGFNKKWWILWVVILIIFLVRVGFEIASQIDDIGVVIYDKEHEIYCIIDSEFQLNEIVYSDNKERVESLLGKPSESYFEAVVHSETWLYKDISVSFVNDRVYEISTSSENYSTPSGLKVGIHRNEVSKILFSQTGKQLKTDVKEIQIVGCKNGAYLVMQFDSSYTVKHLELTIDLP